MKRELSVLLAVAAVLGHAGPASAGYASGWYATDAAGAVSSSGNWVLRGSIGQSASGQLAAGNSALLSGFLAAVRGTSAVGVKEGAAFSFRLEGAAPNPVAGQTMLSFELPEARPIRLRVFDAAGRLRRTVANGQFPAGRHRIAWDVTNDAGVRLGPGIYFLELDDQARQARRKVVVLR